ncbi:unnamed protein product [Alopecurus aequalis]
MSHLHSSSVAVHPLDAEDLLREILLRLPPQPSALPRASLVCKLWHGILSDYRFLRHFRLHHRKPSLLGVFDRGFDRVPTFTPILDPPNRIPAARFTLPKNRRSYKDDHWYIMSCRHGLAVLVHPPGREIVVWDPLANQQKCVPFPPGIHDIVYPSWFWHAVLICVDAEDGHVHGDCFSSPFKLVFIWGVQYKQEFACLYESGSGVWGNFVPMVFPDHIDHTGPNVVVGNAIYWLFHKGDVAAFDFERQSFALIEEPDDAHTTNYKSVQLLRTENGGLGLAVLSEMIIKLWDRITNRDGVGRWLLLQKTIQLELFPCTMRTDCEMVLIVGYDEDSNVIVLSTAIGNFILEVDSVQIRHIIKRDTLCYKTLHPYTSFHIGDDIGLGSKNCELYSSVGSLVQRTKKQVIRMFTTVGSKKNEPS